MSDLEQNKKHRLFVALDVPESHALELYRMRDEHIDARWTQPGQYHLTLDFIGYVTDEQRDAIAKTLRDVWNEPFSLELSGFDAFPSPSRARVIVIHVLPNEQLTRLQQRIVLALSNLGFEPENRPFRPHLTLARIKRPESRQIRAFLQAHESIPLSPFPVSNFHLYESTLSSSGAFYERIETYRLE